MAVWSLEYLSHFTFIVLGLVGTIDQSKRFVVCFRTPYDCKTPSMSLSLKPISWATSKLAVNDSTCAPAVVKLLGKTSKSEGHNCQVIASFYIFLHEFLDHWSAQMFPLWYAPGVVFIPLSCCVASPWLDTGRQKHHSFSRGLRSPQCVFCGFRETFLDGFLPKKT